MPKSGSAAAGLPAGLCPRPYLRRDFFFFFFFQPYRRSAVQITSARAACGLGISRTLRWSLLLRRSGVRALMPSSGAGRVAAPHRGTERLRNLRQSRVQTGCRDFALFHSMYSCALSSALSRWLHVAPCGTTQCTLCCWCWQ